MRIRFGDCVLDSETRELTRADGPVHVSPKAFQLLEVLIRRRPKAMSKEQLHELIWPNTFVSDTALTTIVKEARAAIGDDARAPRFIRTLPAFGYAFRGDAREDGRPAGSGPYCRLVSEGVEVTLREGENILGRGPESVMWLEHDTVSRHHARIRVQDGKALLEDLSSKNGTFLREKSIEGPVELRDGDEIRLGAVALRFRLHQSPQSTKSPDPSPKRADGRRP